MGGEYPSAALRRIESSGLTTESFDDQYHSFGKLATAITENWHGDQALGLYIYGEPGKGKSTAALCLARMVLDQRNQQIGDDEPYEATVWVQEGSAGSVSGLAGSEILAACKDNPLTSNAKMSARSPVVIVDDFGQEGIVGMPKQQQQLLSLTAEAEKHGALLIVTSNLTDPFAAFDAPGLTDDEALARAAFDQAQRIESAGITSEQDDIDLYAGRVQQRSGTAASLRGKFNDLFMMIRFDGPNMRAKTSLANTALADF